MSGALAELCRGARPELAALGPSGAPLADVAAAAERIAAGRGLTALDDPAFALDLLTALGPAAAGAPLIGRGLGYLRSRAGASSATAGGPGVTVASAITEYEAGALALLSPNTRRTYRTWIRRLRLAHGPAAPASLSTGDLKDLIARHVLDADGRRVAGAGAEATAITALRHLWVYFDDKRYADATVAARLRKPPIPEPRRRAIRRDEAALLRHLAGGGRDRMLDQFVVTLAERAGLRREEIVRLRCRDAEFGRAVLRVRGKGEKWRDVPMTPHVAAFLRRYAEDRRPPGVPAADWLASEERLLRLAPSGRYPLGRPLGRRRIEDMLARFHRMAPALFADGTLCLHSYRHALATFLDARYGRAMTRRALGHTSRQSPTDFYVHVGDDALRAALVAYGEHLDAQDDRRSAVSVDLADTEDGAIRGDTGPVRLAAYQAV